MHEGLLDLLPGQVAERVDDLLSVSMSFHTHSGPVLYCRGGSFQRERMVSASPARTGMPQPAKPPRLPGQPW